MSIRIIRIVLNSNASITEIHILWRIHELHNKADTEQVKKDYGMELEIWNIL